jgi:tripartite-type tricarboxylate transporter receptor subunit TctC
MERNRQNRPSQLELTRRAALGATAAALFAGAARATEAYPDRPIRVVVPFSPGGGGDIIVRLIGQELTTRLGQTVLVDDRAGAGGNVGSEVVAHAKPDGYTLLMSNVAPMAINATLYRKLPYDPVASFTAITPLAVFPNVLVVPPSLGVSTLAELIQLGKTKPGGLTFASAGAGSITHLSAEMMAARTGLKMVHAAYRGGGPALAALAGSQVDLYFSSLPAALPYVKSGTLRALGVTSARRAKGAPDIPTLAESGLPGFEAVTWIGLVGPAGMPAAVVDRLNREVGDILAQSAMEQRLVALGAEPLHSSPAEYADYIRAEVARWAEVVHSAGLQPQ